MKKFSRKNDVAAQVQMRSETRHPFGALDSYSPLGDGNVRMYRTIREAIPILDAAILKLVRLCGGFTVTCGNPTAETELRRFIRSVDTGRGQRGLQAFLDCYLDSMFTCGQAVGEIVLRNDREIAAVLCGNVEDVSIREGDSPLDFSLCSFSDGVMQPLPYQDLLLFTPFHPESDAPYGVSMLRSLPYMTGILLEIYDSIRSNFQRVGSVRYAVVYKPQGDMLDKAYAGQRVQQIAEQWSNAMKNSGSGRVCDFITQGDVDIRVIGADNQIIDSEGPTRQLLEQIVASTGIPPFLLGLSWSSTERMSAQQADMMTSEITAVRRTLTPVLERICDLWMRLHGYAAEFEICWDDINLQDTVEEARAGLYHAQRERILQDLEEEKGRVKA